MLANWIEQTHNGTGGTGTLTLAAVTGSPAYTDVFGTSGTRLVSYAINEFTDATLTVLAQSEAGIGSLALSTGVLTRTKKLATWTGSVYDNTSPSAINFGNTADNIRIDCTPLADVGRGIAPFTSNGGPNDDFGMQSGHIVYNANTFGTGSAADRECYFPHLWQGCGEIAQVGMRVGTPVSSAAIKLAIYELDSDGLFGAMIKDINSGAPMDAAAAGGNRTKSVSGLWLPPGWYGIGLIASHSGIGWKDVPVSNLGTSPLGSVLAVPTTSYYKSGSYSTGLPATAPKTGLSLNFGNMPVVVWKSGNT